MSDGERPAKSKSTRDEANVTPAPAQPIHKHFFAPGMTPDQIADVLLGAEKNEAP